MATSRAPVPERWKRITQITAEALHRPEAERAQWLAEACAGDVELRCEVESLLAADRAAGGFLQTAAIAGDGAAKAVAAFARESLGLVAGRRIGPYEIVRELGHGGMGVVYLAARADLAFEKEVAIKVVRGGFASEIVLQRFADERRILATLEHPNIARLLDGGATTDGLSYFVMEYVDGVPLDAYCETKGLSLTQRLQLFGQVSAAVQYAHQRLVIHRDIKPRNILVTAEGTPKLLDFGIAKLLDPDLAGGQTRTGLRAFTLENASPEQIRGEPMAVTSDVYSLGVLLYQLITGRLPYGAAPLGDTDLVRAICEDPPVRPVAAAREGTRFDVGTELEWVVLKTLRKEPDRRYQSVEQLADDIRRFLSARPVLAAPDSRRYRARKFVTRHRGAVAAGALLILSLVAGLTTTAWQAQRAEQQRARAELRFQNARRLANSMVFELNDAIEAGGTSARALLLTRASEQLDALALDSPDDPVLAEELATAYHRLGDVQGSIASANLGDSASGLANHRKGLALRKALAGRAPDDLEARFGLGKSLISTAYAEDQIGPSLQHAQVAVQTAESLVAARPQEMRFRRHLATAHYALGSQHRAIGDNPRALVSFEIATPLFQAVYDANDSDAEVRRGLALCHKRLGAILTEQERFPEALGHLRKAVELDLASLAASPDVPARRRDLSMSNIQLGVALVSVDDPEAALTAYRSALLLREELARDDPKNAQAPQDLARALWYIGQAENATGDWAAAIASFQRAMPLAARPLHDRDDLSASIVSGLADVYESSGRLAEALQMRGQALGQRRALLAGQPKIKTLRRAVARDAMALGGTLMSLADQAPEPALRVKRRREACAAYDEGLRVGAGLGTASELEPADASLGTELRKGRARCERD